MERKLVKVQEELTRLEQGHALGKAPSCLGTVPFVVECDTDALNVAKKASDILIIIDRLSLKAWPTDYEWSKLLPCWFVSSCAPPMTQAESEQWLDYWKSLSREEQLALESNLQWSLDDWLHWMHPSNRQWFWDHAVMTNQPNKMKIFVEVEGWPFPWAALRWLFKASGAIRFYPEE